MGYEEMVQQGLSGAVFEKILSKQAVNGYV